MANTSSDRYPCDDNDTGAKERLQLLLDYSSRYFERLEALNVSLENKANQILAATLAITAVVIPLYLDQMDNGPKHGVWLIQVALVVLFAIITMALSLSVAPARIIRLPSPNPKRVYFENFAPAFITGKSCDLLYNELIQLWGNPRKDDKRPESERHGAIGRAQYSNDQKDKHSKWLARSFTAFVSVLYVGSIACGVIAVS